MIIELNDRINELGFKDNQTQMRLSIMRGLWQGGLRVKDIAELLNISVKFVVKTLNIKL